MGTMKILFLSQNTTRAILTIKIDEDEMPYETYLFNKDNGYQELHNSAQTLEGAVLNHRLLCQKCYVTVNV
jgi:hypothetical protein